MIVGITPGVTMDLSEYDDSPVGAVKRQCRVYERVGRHGVRWNGRYRYYLVPRGTDGAERDTSENKTVRSKYRKTMMAYWSSVDWRVRERAERMSKYVNNPVPSRALAISLKKQGANAPGVVDTGATEHERNGSAR